MCPFCGTHPGISLFIYHTTVSSQIRKWRRAAGTKATRVFRVLWKIHTHLWPRFQIELVPVTHSHSQSPALTVSTEVSTEGGDEARAEREREGTESDFDTDADKVANYWTPHVVVTLHYALASCGRRDEY